MNIELAITFIGPFVLVVNIASLFFCFKPKRSVLFTVAVFAVYASAVHFLYNPIIMHTPFAPYGGVIVLPVMLLLFRGRVFKKIFGFFMCGQVSSMLVTIANAIVGSVMDTQSQGGQIAFFVLSILFLCVYIVVVLRFGKRLFERIFVDDRPGVWALYSLGSMFSFFIAAALLWPAVGPVLYIAIMLFILWSFGVLCFTIINTHEKIAHIRYTQTLEFEMNAMREQTEAEKAFLADMAVLRHDMRHEMGVIMELYRMGKYEEAEAVYANWRSAVQKNAAAENKAEQVVSGEVTE